MDRNIKAFANISDISESPQLLVGSPWTAIIKPKHPFIDRHYIKH